MQIRISKEDDRVAVAAILFKNGYTVKPIKAKDGNKTVHCIEVSPDTKEV